MKERLSPKVPCEATEHVASCPCVGCQLPKPDACRTCPKVNDDHFTPKSIAKLLGWSERYVGPEESEEHRLKYPSVEDPENHQWLSYPCHTEKDRDTSLRKTVLQRQLKGEDIPFDVHRQIFEMGNLDPLKVYEQYGEAMQPGVEYQIQSPHRERRRGRKK